MNLKSGQRIKPNSLEKASRKITEMYKEDGYFNVEVTPTIVVPQDTIVRVDFARDVLFTIKENKKYRLKNVVFEGNNSFSDRKLRKELTNTKQRKWWTFWVKSFDPKTFNEDKETLLAFYQNEGHRDFRVLSDTLLIDEENLLLHCKLMLKRDQNIISENLLLKEIRLLKRMT